MKQEETRRVVFSDGESENYTIWQPDSGCERCLDEAMGNISWLVERAEFHIRFLASMKSQEEIDRAFYRHWRKVHMEGDFTRVNGWYRPKTNPLDWDWTNL
jgi:hypothetical protein